MTGYLQDGSLVNSQPFFSQLDEPMLLECPDDLCKIGRNQPLEFGVADIARRDQQQPRRPIFDHKGLHKIIILGHDHPVFLLSKRDDVTVRGTITPRQVEGVFGVVPLRCQPESQPFRQLRIDQEFHAAG